MVAILIVLLPTIRFYMLSFYTAWYERSRAGAEFIEGFTLGYYGFVLGKRAAPIVNTIIVAFGATGLTLLLSIPAAYAFARYRFRYSDNLAYWLLSLRLLPPIAFILPLFILIYNLGLLDTQIGLILAQSTFLAPFGTWLLRSFFAEIPKDLEEAAWIDGASKIRAFRSVLLPLASSGIVATAIFCMIFSWSDYLFPLILTRQKAVTMPVSLFFFRSVYGIEWGPAAALSMLATIPLIAFVLLVQKYFVKGITMGAVKG